MNVKEFGIGKFADSLGANIAEAIKKSSWDGTTCVEQSKPKHVEQPSSLTKCEQELLAAIQSRDGNINSCGAATHEEHLRVLVGERDVAQADYVQKAQECRKITRERDIARALHTSVVKTLVADRDKVCKLRDAMLSLLNTS